MSDFNSSRLSIDSNSTNRGFNDSLTSSKVKSLSSLVLVMGFTSSGSFFIMIPFLML